MSIEVRALARCDLHPRNLRINGYGFVQMYPK